MSFVKDEPTADLSQIAADLEKLPKAEAHPIKFSGKLSSTTAGMSFDPSHGDPVVDALWNATHALAKQIKQDGLTKPLTIYAAVAPEYKYLVSTPDLADVTIKKLVVTVKLEE